MKTLLLALTCLCLASTAHAQKLPDSKVTPGIVQTISKQVVCGTTWGNDRRHVTEAMKRQVAASYGLKRSSIVAYGKGPCCEFDHLISRELGGADDVKNLWPQKWADAKKKDALENRLHRMVCAGTLRIEEAQDLIRTDWTQAYATYVKRTR